MPQNPKNIIENNPLSKFTVHRVSWSDGESRLRSVREAVFMHEQGVSAELEWDGMDESCLHALALNNAGEAIGCGRISRDAHIGRMAVMREWRGKRVGTALLVALLDVAREQSNAEVRLSAQVHALPFYRHFGFVEEGEVYMDAGIPHRNMYLRL